MLIKSRTRNTYGADEKFMQNFNRKTGRSKPLRRPTRRWEDKMKIDHREIGCEGMDWVQMD
jgi:hypothetical protein